MPLLNPKTATTYGTTPANNVLTFRERLMERFQPHEYVRVINCDTEPIKWQYLPSHSESHTFTADPMKITTRGDVEVYLLNPGESEVLIGECAYIMIEALYKQISAKKIIERMPDMAPGMARNFNFSDALKQEEYINKIFIQVETPNFGVHQETEELEDTPKVDNSERKLRSHLKEQTN